MSKALYYPYIEVPRDSWLTQSVLYWDKLGCIVPSNYTRNPGRFRVYMREYIREGLIEQVIPGMYTYYIHNFNDIFIDYIDSSREFKAIAAKIRRGDQVHYTPVNIEKLSGVGDMLVERGLAWKGQNEWYLLESKVAMEFMIYLATALSEINEYEPVTREDLNYYSMVRNLRKRNFHYDSIDDNTEEIKLVKYDLNIERTFDLNLRDKNRREILKNLLPVPVEEIDAIDILRFKEQYGFLLNDFRRYIENFINDYYYTKETLRSNKLKDFFYEAKEQQEEIKKSMNRFGWHYIDKFDFAMMILDTALFRQGINTADSYSVSLQIGTLTVTLLKLVNSVREGKKKNLNKPMGYSVTCKRYLDRLNSKRIAVSNSSY